MTTTADPATHDAAPPAAGTSLWATTTIERPAAEVWATLADYGRDPDWRRGVETMAPSTAGPAVVGTTTDEVLHLGGRTYRNGGLVTAVEPGRRLEWRTTSGADANGARTVVPVGDDRCEVTLELVVRPHGIERLLKPVLIPMLRRGLHRDLRRLAALVAAT
jgi:uncharacterized protein YndB with AHSA1/START domain